MEAIQGLWVKRIKYLTTIYYKFIAFQFDAVILIYTLFFVGAALHYNLSRIYQYRETITQGNWVMILQLVILAAMASGSYKGFLKNADEVFLTPLNQHGKAFAFYSFRLSEAIALLIWSLASLTLYFFLSSVGQWHISLWLFWLVGLLFKLIYMNLSFFIYQINSRNIRKITKVLFYSIIWIVGYRYLGLWLSGIMSSYLIITNLCGMTIMLIISTYLKKLNAIPWNRWITDETNSRANNYATLLKTAPIEKGSVKIKASKIANALFTWDRFLPFDEKRALLLLYYRMIVRGKGNISLILQLSAASLGAILILKNSLLAGIGILLISLLLSDFLMSLWYNLKDNVWLRLYPISRTQQYWAYQWGAIVILLPIFILLVVINIAINGAILNPAVDLFFICIWLLIITQIKAFSIYTKMFLRV